MNGSYYGFGLGAVSYLDNYRISNTKNLSKYLDGEYSSEEWEQKVAQRKSWRIEIRELEGEKTDGLGTD